MRMAFKYQTVICCTLTSKHWLLFIQNFTASSLQISRSWMSFKSFWQNSFAWKYSLYVLIKSRLRDGLDHLQNLFALFLNPYTASKQNVDLEKSTIASKIKLFLLFLFSTKLAVNFDMITYLYIFCSIPNGSWSHSKRFDMLMLSMKRDLLNSAPRINFKMFLQDFFMFQGILFVFSKKTSLTWIPRALFDLKYIFELALPKSASKIRPKKSLQIFSAQKYSLVFP